MVQVPILTMVDDTFAIAECGHKSVAINQFINSHIELKKLRMHTPDENGKTKCHKIHVGCGNQVCPGLLVHGTAMKEVKEDTYLGDVIRGDGKNTSSVKSRVSKGIGVISQIMNVLESVSFGKFYFQIALTLREAVFLNSILTNTEVWYGLRKSEIEELESLDRVLIRKILSLPKTTPIEALYLETGCLNIGTILKMRRLNFLHYLLKCDDKSVLKRFFQVQDKFPVEDDWSVQARLDLNDFGIPSDLNYVQSKSKNSFKKLVKKQARRFAFMKFKDEQKDHSKMSKLEYKELKIQDYLLCQDITVSQAKVLLKFRTRMANYGNNFKGTNKHTACLMCENHPDSQEFIFECKYNKDNLNLRGKYEDIFTHKINNEVIETLEKIYKHRECKLK